MARDLARAELIREHVLPATGYVMPKKRDGTHEQLVFYRRSIEKLAELKARGGVCGRPRECEP